MKLKDYQYSNINPLRYSPEMIRSRKGWHCKEHRHNGIQHANCYNKENDIQERIGCLDIECGGLDAGFDIVYGWCIKLHGKNEIYYDILTVDDLKAGIKDRRVLESLCNTLWKFDRLITHYGSRARFDIPFIRTRCVRLGLDFPTYGMLWVTDTYTLAKNLLRLTSNRQSRVARAILGKDEKTTIDDTYWMNVKYGTEKERKKALKYVLDHCEHDVYQLDDNYTKLRPFVRETRTSL